MPKLPFLKFFVKDWLGDTALRSVSVSARGLWIDMLCFMHTSARRGYLQQPSGEPMNAGHITRMTGVDTVLVSQLLRELENSGAMGRTDTGVFYSRRLVRDEQKRRKCTLAGRLGGNPTLKGDAKPQVKPPVEYGLLETSKQPTAATAKERQRQCLDLYQQYPKHVGKDKALQAIEKTLALKTYDELLAVVKAYAAAVSGWPAHDRQFIPHPATWFNQGRYDDDRSTWQRYEPGKKAPTRPVVSEAERDRQSQLLQARLSGFEVPI